MLEPWLLSERIGVCVLTRSEFALARQPSITLDRIASVAARLFSAPIGVVHLTDSRLNWMRPGLSMGNHWSEKDILTCVHSFAADGVGVVADLRGDSRFRSNPLVKRARGVRACASVPVRGPEGATMGTLCILDIRPRRWNERALEFLERLSELTGDILTAWFSSFPSARDPLEPYSPDHRYRELFENAGDFVYTHDLRGRITAINQTAERLLGYQRQELLGMDIAEIVSPEHAGVARQILLEQVGGGIPVNYALSFRAKDGHKVPLDVSTHLLFAHGQPVGLMGFGRDVGRNGGGAQVAPASPRGLLSNDSILGLLESRIDKARATGSGLAVVKLDIDHFRLFNEALGCAAGDEILRLAGERIERCLQPGESVGGIGLDRFLIVLPMVRDAQEAQLRTQSILDQIRSPLRLDGVELLLTASAGLSVFPESGTDATALVRNAETALHRAGQSGRNALGVFAPQDRGSVLQLLELESSLFQALGKKQLRLCFEPLLDMNGTVDGMEVLLSWLRPGYGVVPARRFIPIAEATGIIVPIDEWVLDEACRQNAAWQKRGYPPITISVNVSAARFGKADFTPLVARILDATGMAARLLELEVTESAVMQDVARSVQTMTELRSLGVRLSIDDFGTGYSSLSYIQHLPVNTLKIDQSFLQTGGSPNTALPLIRAIVALAHDFGLTVVAEGVENLDQFDLVRKAGCDKVQGHLFGRADSAKAAERLLAAHRQGPLWRPIR